MRVAGIHANSAEAGSRLPDALKAAPMNARGAALRTLMFPPRNPRVAVALQESAQPKLQWATAPDGSFLVMDGDVYSGPGSDAATRPLRDFLCDQPPPAPLQHCGLFDTQVVQNCISQHLKGKNDPAWKLRAILTVVVWHDFVSRGEL